MLLLGVLAAQAEAAPAAAGSYDLLETEILTGSQASVTFSSLNSTYGADYQHLQLRMVARLSNPSTNLSSSQLSFNSDTTSANYRSHWLEGRNGAVSSSNSSVDTGVLFTINGLPMNSSATGNFGAVVIDILDAFENTKYTTVRALGGGITSTENSVSLNSGVWMDTSSVDSINITHTVYDYVIGSRLSLYGLKASA